MKQLWWFLSKITLILQRLRGRWPSKLPTGLNAFDEFARSTLSTYNIPDLPSYRHAMASMVQHLGPTTDRAPKSFFAKSLRKAQANQVAFEVIQRIKENEKANAVEQGV